MNDKEIKILMALPTDRMVREHMKLFHGIDGGHKEHDHIHKTGQSSNHEHPPHRISRSEDV